MTKARLQHLLPLCLAFCFACEGLETGAETPAPTAPEGTAPTTADPTEPTTPDPIEVADLPAPTLPDRLLSYAHDLPAHFRTATLQGFDNTPTDNPVTDAGATLGRVLFYDRRLSKNGSTSCASCHPQDSGFSDTVARSEGFEGGLTRRNSMPLLNLRWSHRGAMFWDERAASLEAQVLMPIEDAVEMGLSLDELVARVSGAEYYPPLFEAAFGDPRIDDERIAMALAQFVRSIVAYRSKWDEGVALAPSLADDFPNFTSEENRGKAIFFGQARPDLPPGLCGTCHMLTNPLAFAPPGGPAPTFDNTAIFTMLQPANNGLIDEADDGFGEVTGRAEDAGTFKTPSLRNVAQTGPYMHDGRFATLEAVVEFYDRDIQAHPNLDPALRQRGPGGPPVRMNLGPADRRALVAFLRTLTDETIATDERWSDPFGGAL